MKHTLLIITALMLVVGCSSPEPINIDELVERDGIWHSKDTNKPYSGDVVGEFGNGQIRVEFTFKNGKPDGLYTSWYENGQKFEEGTYKNGKRERKWTVWYESGKLGGKGTYKDGKWDGLVTEWHENGQKWEEETWKDGKFIERIRWDEYGNVTNHFIP